MGFDGRPLKTQIPKIIFQIPNTKYQKPNSKYQIPNSRKSDMKFIA